MQTTEIILSRRSPYSEHIIWLLTKDIQVTYIKQAQHNNRLNKVYHRNRNSDLINWNNCLVQRTFLTQILLQSVNFEVPACHRLVASGRKWNKTKPILCMFHGLNKFVWYFHSCESPATCRQTNLKQSRANPKFLTSGKDKKNQSDYICCY